MAPFEFRWTEDISTPTNLQCGGVALQSVELRIEKRRLPKSLLLEEEGKPRTSEAVAYPTPLPTTSQSPREHPKGTADSVIHRRDLP
jgi:hypothetical protein